MRQINFTYREQAIELWVHDNEYLSNQIAVDCTFYEAAILDLLQKSFPEQKTIVDAGANIGNHAVYFMEFFKPQRLLCFEPFEPNYEVLVKNLERYKGKQVEAYNMALGAETKTVALQYHPENLGMCEVIHNLPGLVEMRTLDSFALEDVTFLKIDVENSFLYVIQGALDMIRRCRPVILTEGPFEQIFPLLGPLGYLCTGMWHTDVLMYLYQPLKR
jgi:FkbM family methyltransferase